MRRLIIAAAILGGIIVSPAAAEVIAIGYPMPGSVVSTEGREQQAAHAAQPVTPLVAPVPVAAANNTTAPPLGPVTLGNGGLVCELVTPNMARCRIGGER